MGCVGYRMMRMMQSGYLFFAVEVKAPRNGTIQVEYIIHNSGCDPPYPYGRVLRFDRMMGTRQTLRFVRMMQTPHEKKMKTLGPVLLIHVLDEHTAPTVFQHVHIPVCRVGFREGCPLCSCISRHLQFF